MSSNEITTAVNPASIAVTVPTLDKEQILRALNMDPRKPEVQGLVLVCQRYDLDPLLKHAVLISGSLYVTRDGLLHVAHRSNVFDGMEVEQLAEGDAHYVSRCTVWRKDMARPFTFTGRYPKNGRMAQHGPEMADKVAVCRALRHAFDVSLCSQEETWEQEPEAIGNAAIAPAPQPARPESIRQEHSRREASRDPHGITSPGAPAPKPAAPAPTPAGADSPRLVSARKQFTSEAERLALDVRTDGKADIKKVKPILGQVMGYAPDTTDPAEWESATNYIEEFQRTGVSFKARAASSETTPVRQPTLGNDFDDPPFDAEPVNAMAEGF